MIGSSADEAEYWRAEAIKLAKLLMSEYTWVHEYKIAEVDSALEPYLGGGKSAANTRKGNNG